MLFLSNEFEKFDRICFVTVLKISKNQVLHMNHAL